MIKGFGAVACIKLIWESYSSCFQQVCKKYPPIQVALIGPHVGRPCRGTHDWMGPGSELPLPSGRGSSCHRRSPGGRSTRSLFPHWCSTFALGRMLPYSGSSMYYLAWYFNYPLWAFFVLFVCYCKVFWTFFKLNTFPNQKHWPYMVRSWMTCRTYTVIRKEWGKIAEREGGQEFCLVPFWTVDDDDEVSTKTFQEHKVRFHFHKQEKTGSE